MNREHRRSALVAGGFLVAAAAGVELLFLVPRPTARAWIAEPGPFQIVTATLLILVAIWTWTRRAAGAAAAEGGLLLFLALGKLDPGGWLAVKDVDLAAFYTSTEIPLVKKVTAVIGLLLGVFLAWKVFRNGWSRFRRGVREERPAALFVLLAGTLFAAAQVLDQIEGAMVWPHLGYHTHPQILFGSEAAEALLEFLVPVALLGALWAGRRARQDGMTGSLS